MIAVFIRFKRCRVRLIPYNFYYFDGGGGGGDEEYNIIYTACILYYILSAARKPVPLLHIYNNNCKLLFFFPSLLQFDLSFLFLSFTILSEYNIRLRFPRVLPAFPPAAYIATLVRTFDYYYILRLLYTYAIPRLHPSHAASRHPCNGRRPRKSIRIHSSSEIARFDSGLVWTHTLTQAIFPSSVVKFKTPLLGLSLDPRARICHDRRDKSTRLFFNPRRLLRVVTLPSAPPTVVSTLFVERFKNPRYPRAVVHPFSKYAEIDVNL